MAKKFDVPKECTYESDSLMSCLEIGKLLTSTFNLDNILEMIMQKVSQLISAENWSLLLIDESSKELTFEVVVGIKRKLINEVRIPLGVGVAGHVAKTGNPIIMTEAEDSSIIDRKVDDITGFTTQSIACIPLKIHGKILGVVEVINIDDMERFRSKELPILMILADYAAIAIENSQYFSKIQQMSITDEYTGLYNARHLHKTLDNLISESSEKKQKLAAVFVDIDNFKEVVDTHGHLSGSGVLKEIGKTISNHLKETDILFKYGGDEYIILLPGRDKETTHKITENILNAIRTTTYLESDSKPTKVTASFGIAVYPDEAKDKKDLLLIADNRMYKIKGGNKNGIGTI